MAKEPKDQNKVWIFNVGIVMDEENTEETAKSYFQEFLNTENNYDDIIRTVEILDVKKAKFKFEVED